MSLMEDFKAMMTYVGGARLVLDSRFKIIYGNHFFAFRPTTQQYRISNPIDAL